MVTTQIGLHYSGQVNGEDIDVKSNHLTTCVAATLQNLAEQLEGTILYPHTDLATILQWKDGVPFVRKVYLVESFKDDRKLIVKEWDVPSGITNRMQWERHDNYKQYGRVMLLGSPVI